ANPRNERGFSLPELMMTVAILGIVFGMALPVMTDLTASIKLNDAARLVERELQQARLKSGATNTALQVRTNCPATGYVRTVEVLGTAADTAANRCLLSSYPYPAPDTEITTVPNFDGPLQGLASGATVTTVSIEFHSDGTAYQVVSGVATDIVTPVV